MPDVFWSANSSGTKSLPDIVYLEYQILRHIPLKHVTQVATYVAQTFSLCQDGTN